jgi:hypothetical protein
MEEQITVFQKDPQALFSLHSSGIHSVSTGYDENAKLTLALAACFVFCTFGVFLGAYFHLGLSKAKCQCSAKLAQWRECFRFRREKVTTIDVE